MKNGKRMKIVLIVVVILILIAVAVILVIGGFLPTAVIEDVGGEENQMILVADVGEMKVAMENQDYIENQVIAVAESKREAKKIAKQIGGELLSYDNQVAVIQIGVTVEEMMQQLEEDSTLPKVYPNYQGYQNYTN